MKDRNEKRLGGLPGKHASARIAESCGEHQRNPDFAGFHGLLNRIDCGLGIEGVENGFDEQQIDSAIDQGLGLNLIGFGQFVEGDVPRGGVVDGWGDGGGPSGRSHASGDEPGTLRGPAGHLIGRLPCDLCSGKRQIVHAVLESVIGLGYRVGVEGVGFDNIRPGLQIGHVNRPDRVRTCDAENVVVTGQRTGMVGKHSGIEIGLLQSAGLQHGSHGSVEHKNPFLKLLFQKLDFF